MAWADCFDYIGIMSYDGGGVFESPTPVQHATFAQFETNLKSWFEHAKAPKRKIIGGLPFYGYTWDGIGDQNRAISYGGILQNFGTAAADVDIMSKTLYNGRNTIRQKCKYIKDNGYGGVMIWQLLHDASGKNKNLGLLKVIDETINP